MFFQKTLLFNLIISIVLLAPSFAMDDSEGNESPSGKMVYSIMASFEDGLENQNLLTSQGSSTELINDFECKHNELVLFQPFPKKEEDFDSADAPHFGPFRTSYKFQDMNDDYIFKRNFSKKFFEFVLYKRLYIDTLQLAEQFKISKILLMFAQARPYSIDGSESFKIKSMRIRAPIFQENDSCISKVNQFKIARILILSETISIIGTSFGYNLPRLSVIVPLGFMQLAIDRIPFFSDISGALNRRITEMTLPIVERFINNCNGLAAGISQWFY